MHMPASRNPIGNTNAVLPVLNAEEEEDRAPDAGFAGNVAAAGVVLALRYTGYRYSGTFFSTRYMYQLVL